MIVSVITGCLNGIFLVLTPAQRWEAARGFDNNFMAERWFILVGIIAIALLTMLFFVVSLRRTRQERQSSEQMFIEYSEKRGLTTRERRTLLEIANNAGLKRNESIFTLVSAFERGVSKVTENLSGNQGSKESGQLKTDLSFLREKLGFKKQSSYSRGSPRNSTKLNSRQIPVGKKVHLTRRKVRNSDDIESTVTKNSDNDLSVRLEKNVTITFGELWCVRYYFGSSVWEFDTSVISYDGDILVLEHSSNIRFINCRRFLRVPVKMSGFIASFPFERSFFESSHNSNGEQLMAHDLSKTSEFSWGPPEFVPAVVTELAGPGLLIESSLEVKVGERILVVFNLAQAQSQDSIPEKRRLNPTTLKIVEDIGEVRRIERTENGLSIAVELTSLSDPNIDELIRVTNAASLSVNDRNKDMPTSEDAVEHVPEHAVV